MARRCEAGQRGFTSLKSEQVHCVALQCKTLHSPNGEGLKMHLRTQRVDVGIAFPSACEVVRLLKSPSWQQVRAKRGEVERTIAVFTSPASVANCKGMHGTRCVAQRVDLQSAARRALNCITTEASCPSKRRSKGVKRIGMRYAKRAEKRFPTDRRSRRVDAPTYPIEQARSRISGR